MANRISIIVPTYNGANKIPHILEALSQQSIQDFEIIVVVDGSTDNTQEVLTKIKQSFHNLHIIYQANGGRSVSRNRGVAAAKGDYLFFFDDDMRPTPSVLAQHLAHAEKYPDSILVGTTLEDERILSSDIQYYKSFLSRKWSKEASNPETEGRQDPKQPFLTAAHCSMPKALFEKLEGFDERLTDSEDFDLAVKAVQAHIPIYFRPDIIAWHDDFITCQSYIKRQREYSKSHLKLRQVAPERYKDFPQYTAIKPDFPKNIVYSFFARQYWVKLIDSPQNLLKYLPKALKYRIYDWVITGLGVHFTERKIN